jgi:hypothetical protein
VPELDPSLVDRAVNEATKRAANFDYFFDHLSSPEWIQPLRERGLFDEPPAQVIDEQGYVRAPGWAASRYLARVAAAAPNSVASAIRNIHTDNERVHEDFVTAALAMPPEVAHPLARAEAAWLASRDHIYYLLPRRVVELVASLAVAGETEPAIDLIRALFAPSPTARDVGLGLKKPQPRFADWEYDQLLRKVVEEVLPLAPAALLVELVALLGSALDVMRQEEDDESFDVTSRLWRPRVADDRDRASQVEDSLISAVRDSARLIRQHKLMQDGELVSILTSRPEEVLRRITMDALARGPESDLQIVRPFVVDPQTFGEGEPSVEYRDLLTANAERLPAEDLKELLDVVEQGPDLDDYRERARTFGDREATHEEIAEFAAWWRASRLKLLLPALDEEWLARYQAFLAIADDAELPVSGEVQAFTGPTSPLTVDDLAAMEDREVIRFLRDWEPEARWDAPSIEGLARTVAEFAQRHPERISELAGSFRGVRPAYVQWALQGLEGALREGRTFDWGPVVDLFTWVVKQPRELRGGRRDAYGDLDPGWVWTRRGIASLLEQGLRIEGEGALPGSLRERVWAVISNIAEDPDPTPEHELRYGGSNMDPATLALNTTRPRAIRAAIMYAIWLYQVLGFRERKVAGAEPALFDETPEVGRLLLRHLDPAVDSSAAVRAAVGQFYSNLFVLDSRWAAAHATVLFPEEDSPLREAAWGAYVIYTRPYDNVFASLLSVYERSAELVGFPGHGFSWMNADPRARLGEHLASFYWRGVISLEDAVLTTYWRSAPTDVRREVIDFLGHSVRELPNVETDVQERLMAFWDYARAEAALAGSGEELRPFAWWFASAALPVDWRTRQLIHLLDNKIKPDPSFLVSEALPGVAAVEPLRAVQLLRHILELERESWAIDAWQSEIEQVLRLAISSGNTEAHEAAEETAHWLGALGYQEFRSLVPDAN